MQRKNMPTTSGTMTLRVVGGILVLMAFCATMAFAQSPDLQEKLAALKQSTAENQQRLHQYQWIETQQITLKGDPKPSKQFQCQYGPDGQVVKTPMGQQQPQQQQSGGRLKRHVV